MNREKNPLKMLLVLHFGTIQNCAEKFDVSSNTVSRWINDSPENIMRHADRMILLGMDVEQVRDVVTKMAMHHA